LFVDLCHITDGNAAVYAYSLHFSFELGGEEMERRSPIRNKVLSRAKGFLMNGAK
jgi:hypothetical protein